jgi:hypothetical protein
VSKRSVVAVGAVVVVVAVAVMVTVGRPGSRGVEPAVAGPTVPVGTTPSTVTPVTHPIGFIGDSITDQARAALVSQLDADPAMIRAVSGIKIDGMLQSAKELAASRPDEVVINLGTNNVLAGESTDREVDELQRLMAIFADVRCVHLVTINEHMFSWDGVDLLNGATHFNARIRAMTADPRVHVVDWAQIVTDYDAANDPFGPMTIDTVHPDPLGKKLLLDAYQRSLDAC